MSKTAAKTNTNTNSYSLDQATSLLEMADELKKFITERQLTTTIQGKQYVNVEGWQYLGGCLGVMPLVENVEDLSTDSQIKYRCSVALKRLDTGEVIGRGVALCTNSEAKRRNSDEYVIMSMAETRAIGKAFRNTFAWVIRAAGYEPTPAEEMEGTAQSTASPTPASETPVAAPQLATPKQKELLTKLLSSHVFDTNHDLRAKKLTELMSKDQLKMVDASAFIDRLLDNQETGEQGVISMRKDLEEKGKQAEAQISGEDQARFKELFYQVWNQEQYCEAMEFLTSNVLPF